MSAPYQTMPPLSQEDADALERSIRTHGVQVPVLMDEEGAIIDGHHRWEIATRNGIACPTEKRTGLGEAQKIALSISLNVDRRQLTREQKRDLIAASVKAEPQASDRELARRIGVTHPTVASVRAELESSGDVEKLSTRSDSLGRIQPASKPKPDAAPYVDRYPELEHYVEQGKPQDAVRIGGFLDSVPASELPMRREAIKAHIASEPPVFPDDLSGPLLKAVQAYASANVAYRNVSDAWSAVAQLSPQAIESARIVIATVERNIAQLGAALKPGLRAVK